jgi:hypothetical protein
MWTPQLLRSTLEQRIGYSSSPDNLHRDAEHDATGIDPTVLQQTSTCRREMGRPLASVN